MLIEIYDKQSFIIGCDDRDLLDVMQARMDGHKVRMQNKIIIPLKSGPKIYYYKDKGIRWGNGAKETVDKLIMVVRKRKENIAKIKSQYGGDIKFDYVTQGIYPPMEHQKIMFNMMAYSDVCALLADPGTCKTGSYLWAIDRRIQNGTAKKALIVTLSNLKTNVLEEMSVQVPHLKGVILKDKTQANKILNKSYKVKKKNTDYDIYISNYESMFTIVDLFSDDYFDMIVFDEAHRIGSPKSRQTKEIVKKFESRKYKYLITGTLHANNLMSFFMPFRALGSDTVPYAKYDEFQRKHMYTVDPDGYVWVPLPGSKNIVKKIVGDISVVFTKEECLDLPPIVRSKLYCEMGKGQEKLYKALSKDLVAEIEDMCSKCDKQDCCDRSCEGGVEAKTSLILSIKLRQISCGFYKNTRYKVDENGKEKDDSNIITLDENPKLSLLIQYLNNIPKGKQVIIWTNYTHVVETISKGLEKAFGKDSCITCYKQQDAFGQIKKFRETGVPYLVANVSKMGVGHNIQFSNYQVFFSNSHSFVQRDQAESRQHRKGQKLSVTITDLIVLKSIDEIIIKALDKKKDLSISLSELAKLLKQNL